MADLAGKHVVVTGAAGALGRAVYACALAEGARVTGVDVVAPPARGGWISVDLSDAEATAAAFAAFGPVDALLHLVGGFAMGDTVAEPDRMAWDRLFRINVATLQHAAAAVAPGMKRRRRGAIVTVGALSGLQGRAGMSAYCAAKSAVMRITESLSAELAPYGVNANCVLPSIIDTAANRADMPDADPSRWVAPEDLAQVICFLASDRARAVNGALIPVRGLS